MFFGGKWAVFAHLDGFDYITPKFSDKHSLHCLQMNAIMSVEGQNYNACKIAKKEGYRYEEIYAQ